MAHDKSPERSNLILFYTVLSVAVLVALAFVFKSYFTAAFEQEMANKVLTKPNTELEKVEAKHHEQLNTGPMPIDRAIRQLAQRGRGAVPAIQAEPSDDLAALEGWSYAKSQPTMGGVPVSVASAPDAGAAAEPQAVADGGVAAGDGGQPSAAGPPAPDGGVAAPAAGGGTEGSDSEALQEPPGDTTPNAPGDGAGTPTE